MSPPGTSPVQRKQLADIQVLRASISPEEFRWRGTQRDIEQWEKALCALDQTQGEEDDDGEIDSCTPSHSSFLAPLSAAVSLGMCSPRVWLDLALPTSQDREPQLTVRVIEEDRNRVKEDQVAILREEVNRRWKEAKEQAQEYPLFDMYTSLQDYLLTSPLDYTEAPVSEAPATVVLSSSSASFRSTAPDLPPITLSRLIIWSHHLLSNIKRKQISSWCASLRLWGLLKTGYPGYLCFEGLAEDVKEMESNIKGMQWAAILVRDQESWSFDGHEEEGALLACPLAKQFAGYPVALQAKERGDKVRTTCEEIETMKDIVERLRSAGLPEHEVVDALGLRTKQQH